MSTRSKQDIKSLIIGLKDSSNFADGFYGDPTSYHECWRILEKEIEEKLTRLEELEAFKKSLHRCPYHDEPVDFCPHC